MGSLVQAQQGEPKQRAGHKTCFLFWLFCLVLCQSSISERSEDYGRSRFATSLVSEANCVVRFKLGRRSQKIQANRLGFFYLCPQDTISFDRRQHHFEQSENIILHLCGHKTMLQQVANDVILRINDVGYAQRCCALANVLTPLCFCGIMISRKAVILS